MYGILFPASKIFGTEMVTVGTILFTRHVNRIHHSQTKTTRGHELLGKIIIYLTGKNHDFCEVPTKLISVRMSSFVMTA